MGVEVRFPFAKWRRNESYGHPWTNMCIFSDVSSWTEIEGKAFFCFSFLLCIFVIINFGRIREKIIKGLNFKISFGSFKSHADSSFHLKLEEEDHYWLDIKSKNAKYTPMVYSRVKEKIIFESSNRFVLKFFEHISKFFITLYW